MRLTALACGAQWAGDRNSVFAQEHNQEHNLDARVFADIEEARSWLDRPA